MVVKSRRRVTFPALAIAALVSSFPQAFAAGPFDRTWVVSVPPADFNSTTGASDCPALRFPLQIRDGQVTGVLARVPSSDGVVVEAESGTDSAPVTGTVQLDGTVHAQWERYRADGKLDGHNGQVTVSGECGSRVATAVRVSN